MASFYVNIDVEALFCRCSTRFNFHCVHSHGRIWNPPLRSANPVAFCLPPTSAGWGHPALRPTEKGERRAASPLAAVPACAVLRHPGIPETVMLPRIRAYAIRAAAPHSPGTPRGTAPWRKASLVKGRCRACEAEGFLPVCGVHLLPFWRYAPPPPARGSLSLTREAFLLQP